MKLAVGTKQSVDIRSSCPTQADKSKQLGWECLDQVLRFQKEASDDIRLSVRLFKRCLNDQRKFCKDVEPGHMRVQVGGGGAAGAPREVGRTAVVVDGKGAH